MKNATATANASTQIVNACDEVFENGWKSQVEYLRTMYAKFEAAQVLAEASRAANPLYAMRQTDSATFFYRAVYNVERGNPYIDLKATARANFNELLRAMGGIFRKGFETFIASERAAYIADLTAYLRLSLDKKGVQNHAEAANIQVNGSAKGYKVTALVDGCRLTTDCIPVGGYNIVRFHYRYTVKF